MRATSLGVSRVFVITLVAAATVLWSSATAADSPQDASMKQLLKSARKDTSLRDTVRIHVESNLDKKMHLLEIYGRGIGILNGEGQFTLEPKDVVAAIDLLLGAKFSDMPERFAYPDKDEDEEMPVKLYRVITVTVGGTSKTVIQDNKGPKSEPFAKLTVDLMSLCRKPAETLVTASNLADGLEKVAQGTLAPETLTVIVNAPELRSLESQEGQGWQLTVQHGQIVLTSVTIAHGINQVSKRTLGKYEAQKLAQEFLKADVADLPSNINTRGYTQLTVAVLNQKARTMARTFAGEPEQDAKEAAASFNRVREMLFAMYEKGVKARKAD